MTEMLERTIRHLRECRNVQLICDQILCEGLGNAKVLGEAAKMHKIIWIDQWVSECMRDGAATGLVEILSYVGLRRRQSLYSCACFGAGQLGKWMA